MRSCSRHGELLALVPGWAGVLEKNLSNIVPDDTLHVIDRAEAGVGIFVIRQRADDG